LAQPSPTHPVAEYYLKRGRFREAKPIAEKMVARHPKVQVGHNVLSIINWKLVTSQKGTKKNKKAFPF